MAVCDGGGPTGDDPQPPAPTVEVVLEPVANGLAFPLHLTAPRGDERLFVVEKGGAVRIVRDGRLLADPFLDLRGRVSSGGEQGLLSIAFHPGYAANGRFFVDYTDAAGDTRVEEYRVSGDPDRADPAPVRTILTVDQPFTNHNGGLVVFGPDGSLYVGLGDGGGAGDPQDNAQDTGNLLGSILRLDVDGGAPFAIPPDNPFAGDPSARSEIWVYGLRNPWRFSFDRRTGDLFIGDVGQNDREEIDAVSGDAGGTNFGWKITEGSRCFSGPPGCDTTGLTLPVVEYDHGDGCSVIGGHVYRGQALPELDGTYFYSDLCSGFVRSFRFVGRSAVQERDWPTLEPGGTVTSLGEDADGELYLLTGEGSVFRIARAVADDP